MIRAQLVILLKKIVLYETEIALMLKTGIRLKSDSKAVVTAQFFSAEVQYKQTKERKECVGILQCRTFHWSTLVQ